MRTVIAVVLLVVAACSRSDTGGGGEAESLEAVKPAANLMAIDFFDAFEKDAGAAAKEYTGKVVQLTGIYFTWTLVERPGGSKAAADITLRSHGSSEKGLFVLDRAVMDKRYLILDYYSLIVMKGRYAGREADGTFRFTDSVLTTTRPQAKDYPTAATATAEELAGAFWPSENDATEGRRYAGRVVEVAGEVQGFAEGEVLLRATNEDQPIHCGMADGVAEFRRSHDVGSRVLLKGFCSGHVAMTRGVTLEHCIVL